MKTSIEMLSVFPTHDRLDIAEWPDAYALLGRLVYATGFAGEPGWKCQVKDSRRHDGKHGKDSVQVREETPTQRKVLLRLRATANTLHFDVFLFFALHSQPPADVIRAIRLAADKVSGRIQAVYSADPLPPPPPSPAEKAERLERAAERMRKAIAAYRNMAAVEELKATAEAALAAAAERIRGPRANREELAGRVEELRDGTVALSRQRADLDARLQATAKALAEQSAQLDVARTELEAADVTYRPLLAEYGAAEQALREVEANERELRAALERAGPLDEVLSALEGMS